MKFTIKRSEWNRGSRYERSFLYHPEEDNLRCCLGFFGNALGISDVEMMGQPYPSVNALSRPVPYDERWPRWLVDEQGMTGEGKRLMLLNDSDKYNKKEEAREEMIAEIFGRNGVEVTFEE